MDGGQNSTDQHHQQIDFHFVLRSSLQALTSPMQNAFHPVQ
jgi:hypothetical protein